MRITLNKDGSWTPQADPYEDPGDTGNWWETELDKTLGIYDIDPDDVGRSREDALREPFIWKTDKGELWEVADMNTMHLFNAYKMLHNNTVPPAFRVGSFKPHLGIKIWDEFYVSTAIRMFIIELELRRLETPYNQQFQDIKENRKYLGL